MKNKILTILLVVVLLFCSTTFALAQTDQEGLVNQPKTVEPQISEDNSQKDTVVDVPIYDNLEEAEEAYETDDTTELEIDKAIEDQNSDKNNDATYDASTQTRSGGTAHMSYFVIRSGNTQECELYGRWKALDLVDEFSFTNLKVNNYTSGANYLNMKPASGHKYKWFYVRATLSGTSKIKDFKIPKTVKRVSIAVKTQMMHLAAYDWISLGNFTISPTIN